MHIEQIVCFLIAALLLWRAIRPWWDRWRTRDWPTAPARIIDTMVASRGRFGSFDPRNDLRPAYAIEYDVEGRRYELGVDASLSFDFNDGRFAFWKLTIPREFEVRYRQDRPREFCIAHAYAPATMAWATAAHLSLACLTAAFGRFLG